MLGAIPESVEAGLLGGEAAKIAGGKFDEGFTTAAEEYLATFKPSSEQQTGSPWNQFTRVAEGAALDVYAAGVGQLGAVYAFFEDISQFGNDLVSGNFGSLGHDLWNAVYDLALPHYGYYGGAGWGTRQFPNGNPAPLNQQDEASYLHDLSCTPPSTCDNVGWVSNGYNGDQSFLPTGIFGNLYKLVGTIPFEAAGHMP